MAAEDHWQHRVGRFRAAQDLTVMKLRILLSLFFYSTAFAADALRPDALVADVLTRHPELSFYEAELAAAKAARSAAGIRSDPDLSVELGRKRVRDMSGALAGEGTAWSVSLAQTFEWPGRIALRKAIANRDVELAELGLARFKAALKARVLTLAYSVDAEQEKAAAVQEVAERFRALKEVFLARDPAGVTPLLETRVIEAQELAIQRRATTAGLAAKSAEVELNQLRGMPVESAVVVEALPLTFREAPALTELVSAARDNHFEFRARRLELAQQGYLVQLARNERKPSFTVSPFYSQEKAGDRESIVGVGLSVPLPLSSRSRTGVDVAEARRRQAEASLHVAEREMERAVIDAARTFEAKRSEVARWSPASVEKFREAAALADRHYRLGAVPLATYVELQTAYLEAVESLLDTKKEALEAAQQLELLAGLATSLVSTTAEPAR
jgi:cobalt-zinc-cadmium efflux system outer membrane protein